jgi:hypothetical protein
MEAKTITPKTEGEVIVQPTNTPTKIKRVIADLSGALYDVIGMYYPNGLECGFMCQSDPCWLIISGFDKSAYAFSEDSYISPDYILEKLCPKGTITDAKNLAVAIHKIMEA